MPTYAESARSIAIDYTAPGGVFALRRSSPLDTTGYDRIVVYLHGGENPGGTGDLRFFVREAIPGPASPFVVVNAPAEVWTQVIIPLSDLGNPSQIAGVFLVDFVDGDNPVFYADSFGIACTP